MIRRLDRLAPLRQADRETLLALPHHIRACPASQYLVRDGDEPDQCCLLLSGFAYRHKVTGEGARQIISIHMASEFVDLQNIFLDLSDHSVQALTEAEIAFVPRRALRDVALSSPAIGRALWIETLIDASIFREWVVNVGRRDSRSRVAHLLCEFSLRLEAAGLARDHCYELPMTQEQLADTVGLTPVHVNRVLRQLGEEGLIERDRRSIRIVDWSRMRNAGDFNERYLHHQLAGLAGASPGQAP
ncbi:MAG TPA: Crp/Fnr family transcriptional regulator [Allosphingosinicella sp.]|nr:Crp/Fnr family transcriptional regulator [Allosphingosinicella sp.]